jgi:Tfp pilus assembly protein PilZ
MPDERRTARRATLPGVRATFEGATGQQQQADVPNLARGGLFLETESPVPAGKRLSLEIHVIGQPAPWSALGRVAWARWLAGDDGPAGMGVKLIDIEDDVSDAIEALVERLSPLEPLPGVPDPPPSRPRVPGAGTPPPQTSLLIAPLVRPPVNAPEPNVAIDLVTRKSGWPLPLVEAVEEEPLEQWDETFLKPKRHLGRWVFLGLLLGSALSGYIWRDRLLVQWSRFRALTMPAQTEVVPSSPRSPRA